MGHHVKRGKALRGTLPLTDRVCEVRQSSLPSPTSGESRDHGQPALLAGPGSQRSTCPPLCAKTGEPQRADGARRGTRHLERAACVVQAEHGRLRAGGQGEWEGGKGAPNETPRPSRRVGRGRGVGARDRRAQQAQDGWRRPLALGKRGAQVSSERARCPRGRPCGAGAMSTDAAWMSMEKDHRR